MPRTALEPLDSSWQPARFVVLDDRRLQVNRVDHRSFAGYSLHNLGSGQQVAAGARWRGGAARIASANELSCSERATMWLCGFRVALLCLRLQTCVRRHCSRAKLEGVTGKPFSNYGGHTNYAYEHVAHSETEHLA